MQNFDFIVLGAGLSGLACASTLKKAGRSVLLIEQNSNLGGRVKTTTVDGFLIDEGFQVLLNSYPELQKFVDLAELKLKTFNSGAYIYNGTQLELLGNPFVHPKTLLSTLLNKNLNFKDQMLVTKLIFEVQSQTQDTPLGKQSTYDFLVGYGFSEKFIENFWRPFLTGVFLDPKLNIGCDFFKFLIRCFGRGQVSVPALGMAELPKLMAKELDPSAIQLNTEVLRFDRSSVDVKSANGLTQKMTTKQIICAFDISSQTTNKNAGSYHAVTTFYFTSSKLSELGWDKWLILIPQHLNFKMDHMTIISNVSSSYSASEPLLSVSVVGNKSASSEELIIEIEKIAQKKLNLKWVKTCVVKKALPELTLNDRDQDFEIDKEGVIYCGDRFASPSIQGALKSGRKAAEAAMKSV